MTAAAWLRVAAVLAFLQFVAHAGMFISAKPRNGPSEVAVVEAMKTHRFSFAGARRSYWDMYFGYGLLAAAFCLVESILFLQLAGGTAEARPLVRSIALLFAAANVAHIGLVARYFFFVPAVADALIAAALAVAVLRL